MNRKLRTEHLRTILALIGGAVLIGSVVLYIQGWMATRKLDPDAIRVWGHLVETAIESNFAAASIIKIPLGKEVTIQEAARAIKQRAISHGMKSIGQLRLHEGTPSTGKKAQKSPYLKIFIFHAPETGSLILGHDDWELAAHMPYRIVLYRGEGDGAWIAAMDPGLLIHGARELEPELKSGMTVLKDRLLDVMAAGASGGRDKGVR